jgi:prepilin-type N-terminal cleavage/methylation domain-containing protein
MRLKLTSDVWRVMRNKNHHACRAFTMVEIAISLAVIGIALVAILGVLPLGMQAQRSNREATVINSDAGVFVDAIRGGARGADDLVNYVVMITNTISHDVYSNPSLMSGGPKPILTNGAVIIGLLSTPEFVDSNSLPTTPLNAVSNNRMVAYVRSLSGPAVDKPPQDNALLRNASFSYEIVCQNSPVEGDTNMLNSPYGKQLTANLHELRLMFQWPLLPDSQLPKAHLGLGSLTYRAMIAGQLVVDTSSVPGVNLYFFQPQSFVNAP